jgi:hypothetical protein
MPEINASFHFLTLNSVSAFLGTADFSQEDPEKPAFRMDKSLLYFAQF